MAAVEPVIVLSAGDAGELLTLQRAAYVTEAQSHADPHLPPLVQTLDELRAELDAEGVTALGIRERGRLLAGVRLRRPPGRPQVAEIGRLAVVPDRQGEGLGTRLLVEAERRAGPGVTTIVLFTGERSDENLRLYRRHGYIETHRTPAGNHRLVHLEKRLGAPPA
jgi:ribosomal protein S18 acetylase RimI-like enzyme